MSEEELRAYLADRVDNQLRYFDASAVKNQRAFRRLKAVSIACNVLTTMTIALAFTVLEEYKVFIGMFSLISSTIVFATH